MRAFKHERTIVVDMSLAGGPEPGQWAVNSTIAAVIAVINSFSCCLSAEALSASQGFPEKVIGQPFLAITGGSGEGFPRASKRYVDIS